MILTALRSLLVRDPHVARGLAAWDFGDGVERPAVFTVDPAPAECPNPVIVLALEGGADLSTAGKRGGEAQVSITLWGDREASDLGLRTLAWDIWRALKHTDPTSPDGYDLSQVEISPPARLTDADGFPGYRLDAAVSYLET